MSADEPDLGERINQTITEYLAERGGGFVTAFHVAVEFADSDGDSSWLYAVADGQRMSTTIGLIEWARGIAAYEQHRYLESLAGD